MQTASNAISTATHGTGATFGTLSTQVAGLRLVTADGGVLDVSRESDPETFRAAQVGLGLTTGAGSLLQHFGPAERVDLLISALAAVVLTPLIVAARGAFPARLYPASRRAACCRAGARWMA